MKSLPCIRRPTLHALGLILAWTLLVSQWMFQSSFAAQSAVPTTPSLAITLKVLPSGADSAAQVQIDADKQPLINVARALLTSGVLRFQGIEVLSDTVASFHFDKIEPVNLLSMIATTGGAALTYDQDGALVLRPEVSDPEYAELLAQFQTTFESPEAATRALLALRKLEAPRGDGKLAPSSGYLADLASHYKIEQMFDEQVALRREMLTTTLQRDARPDSLTTAEARAALAVALYAANQAQAGETELRKAWPVLHKYLASIDAGGTTLELAELLRAQGRAVDAQQLFQHVFDNAYAGDVEVWVWKVLPAARALLASYRGHDNAAARKLLTRWRAQADQLESYPWADQEIEHDFATTLDVAAFAQTLDIEIALLPSWSRVSADQLDRWLRLMVQHDLHAGRFAQAAQKLAIAGDLQLACGGQSPTEEQRLSNQATLQRLRSLGDVSPAGTSLRADKPSPPWRCAESSSKPLFLAPAPVYQIDLDRAAMSILLKADAIKPNLALIEAAEHTAIAVETLEIVRAELLGKARAWRQALGQSTTQIAKRDAWVAEQLQKTQTLR